MEKTPNSLRKHIIIAGCTNAGKSTLFNAMTEQDKAIVSEIPGTTTDPVSSAMELIPYGPIVLVDTAGFGDESALGAQRMSKTKELYRKADAALFIHDANESDMSAYERFKEERIDHLLVMTKCTEHSELAEKWSKGYPEALFLQETVNGEDAKLIKEKLIELLLKQKKEADKPLIGDLLSFGSRVLLIIPIDSEAPKGRLILPQVQVLRDCLDNGMACTVCRETELESALENQKSIDLVITDSQVFGYVNERVPLEVPLTSFSMLLARQKGNFAQLCEGVKSIDRLKDGSRILMLEGCTHNSSHEDIGRVKIPLLLKEKTGKSFDFSYFSGYDFPEDLSQYDLAVQCGGCMLNRKELATRLVQMERAGLPVTNYGILLAWINDIFERSCEIFTS